MTEHLIRRASAFLDRSSSRRGFLARIAAVGAAASVAPLRTLISPAPAFGAFGDGFTEFCCSVVGSNRCPSFTFIGGLEVHKEIHRQRTLPQRLQVLRRLQPRPRT